MLRLLPMKQKRKNEITPQELPCLKSEHTGTSRDRRTQKLLSSRETAEINYHILKIIQVFKTSLNFQLLYLHAKSHNLGLTTSLDHEL
jgi:hypothetical protein